MGVSNGRVRVYFFVTIVVEIDARVFILHAVILKSY